MSWRPSGLWVVNVGGRALLCDSYLIAEWRNDPWKGFDLAEGYWSHVKGTQYRHGTRWGFDDKTRRWGDIEVTDAQAGRVIRGFVKQFPPPSVRVQRDALKDREGYSTRVLIAFSTRSGRTVWVDPEFLETVLHLIDGEPAEWRNDGFTKPLHALDERGRWLGAIMPVLVPEQRAVVMKKAAA